MAPVDCDKNDFSGCLFVSWDVDTTGKRLLDDICNIGAHCNEFSMQQYIMPYRDIVMPMIKWFRLATTTIGPFRVLRNTVSGKIMRTKSELFGLLDFITKLEAHGEKGIVLMCYERRKLAPYLLIEGLQRYNLLDRFKKVVKGFANGFEFVKVNCAQTMVTYSLKTLAKILLDKEPKKLYNAAVRAKVLHEIIVHLSTGESNDPVKDLADKMTPYVQSFEDVEKELTDYKIILEKQRTLKPIFWPMIQEPKKRKKAVALRQNLTDAAIDYSDLETVISEEKDLKEFLHSQLGDKVTKEDIVKIELLVVKHFKRSKEIDATEKPQVPDKKVNKERPVRNNAKNNRKKERKGKAVENGISETKQEKNKTVNGEQNEVAPTETEQIIVSEKSGDNDNSKDTKESPNNKTPDTINKSGKSETSTSEQANVSEDNDASKNDQPEAAKI